MNARNPRLPGPRGFRPTRLRRGGRATTRAALVGLSVALGLHAAPGPAAWRFAQPMTVPQAGVVKVALPLETLDAARPGLEDLRLVDATGRELPFALERVRPPPPAMRAPRSFAVTLEPSRTVMFLATGSTAPIEAVALETPTAAFMKAVRVEGSNDRTTWTLLARDQPLFRQANGAAQLRVAWSPGRWAWLRLTVDDRRSEPVPFTGARLQEAAPEPLAATPLALTLAERVEQGNETRLVLQLAAAHVQLAHLEFDSAEPWFTREVTVRTRQIGDDGLHEAVIARGTVYRLPVPDQPMSEQLRVAVEAPVPTRELVVTLANLDSPPLPLSAVRAAIRPTYVVFHAAQPGPVRLLSGHRTCAAPRYDLAALVDPMRAVSPTSLAAGPLAPNPSFAAPETLPTVDGLGAPLDPKPWRFRQPVRRSAAGVHTLELPLEVLAHARADLADLRLLSDGHQVAYLRDSSDVTRAVPLEVTRADDPKRPTVSRWSVKLPWRNLPLLRVHCTSSTPLFERQAVLYELRADERGERHRSTLGTADWRHRPDQPARPLVLALSDRPQTDLLHLEVDNGDNPPIELARFEGVFPMHRLRFKAPPPADAPLYLYYGQPDAVAPRYDLALVGPQLFAAEREVATLGGAEPLRADSWAERHGASGVGAWWFWLVLGVVVVALLTILARFMPRADEPPARS